MNLIHIKDYLLWVDENEIRNVAEIPKIFWSIVNNRIIEVDCPLPYTLMGACKIIAHLPLNDSKPLPRVLWLPEFENLKNYKYPNFYTLFQKHYPKSGMFDAHYMSNHRKYLTDIFEQGYKAASKGTFSLDDVEKAIKFAWTCGLDKKDLTTAMSYLELTSKLPIGFVLSDKFPTFEENIKHGTYIWE